MPEDWKAVILILLGIILIGSFYEPKRTASCLWGYTYGKDYLITEESSND